MDIGEIMPLPAHRRLHHSGSSPRPSRRRTHLGLLWSRGQHKTLLALAAGAVVYSYAFFGGQPDRSLDSVFEYNEKQKHRAKLRLEQKKLARKNGGHAPPLLLDDEEEEDGMPEWQRKMRAGFGDLAWRKEQDALNTFLEDEYEDGVEEEEPKHLRGSDRAAKSTNVSGGAGGGESEFYPSAEGEEINTKDGDSKNSKKKRRKQPPPNPFVDFILFMSIFTITRSILRLCLYQRHLNNPNLNNINRMGRSTSATNNRSNNNNDTIPIRNNHSISNSGRSALARLMVPQSIQAHAALLRHARFRAWVTDLNRERAQHGQPPLSLESLRLVMRDSDFSGNDYDALMQFHEEATLAQSIGATQAEIDRYPLRVLSNPHDDLLECSEQEQRIHQQSPHSRNYSGQECSICLEAYQINDRVRRIPCMHEFHVHCIDPWLSHKAVCPICKHPIVG